MVGLALIPEPSISTLTLPSISTRPPSLPSYSKNNLTFPSRILQSRPLSPRKSNKFLVFAENNNGLNKEEEKEEIGSKENDDSKEDQRPIFNIRWSGLLDPDPDNIVAVGLTGVLAWASIQVLWQLFFISFAILVAALKYSFVAALLILILITLL